MSWWGWLLSFRPLSFAPSPPWHIIYLDSAPRNKNTRLSIMMCWWGALSEISMYKWPLRLAVRKFKLPYERGAHEGSISSASDAILLLTPAFPSWLLGIVWSTTLTPSGKQIGYYFALIATRYWMCRWAGDIVSLRHGWIEGILWRKMTNSWSAR